VNIGCPSHQARTWESISTSLTWKVTTTASKRWHINQILHLHELRINYHCLIRSQDHNLLAYNILLLNCFNQPSLRNVNPQSHQLNKFNQIWFRFSLFVDYTALILRRQCSNQFVIILYTSRCLACSLHGISDCFLLLMVKWTFLAIRWKSKAIWENSDITEIRGARLKV